MLKFLLSWADDFLSLVYPRLCMACGNSLYLNEEILCTHCMIHLPQTHFHLNPEDNPIVRNFWGRVRIRGGAARYFFRKSGPVQHLLHNFKYNNAPEIGFFIGNIYGKELLENVLFRSVNVIIPVPLHEIKLRKRGYNQAAVFARGLSRGMNIPCDESSLVRTVFTETQTRKSRLKRWENVKTVFEVKNAQSLENKHILLVDDVITTGATMEACMIRLEEIEGVTVSVAAIATAAQLF